MTQIESERPLARAEFRPARRRRLLRLAPGAALIAWALADLVAARHRRLADLGVPALRHVADHLQAIAWTVLVVFGTYALAFKPRPLRLGVLIAMATGPVLTPILFGYGGWHPWQIVGLAALAWATLAVGYRRGARARVRAGGTPSSQGT